MSHLLEHIADNCQIGVDLFLLLSGMGIAFSLSKTTIGKGDISLKTWYIRRFKRIYVPFTVIMLIFYMYAIPFEGKSLKTAILDIANVGWWIDGKGTWYVSLILLLYLVSPLLYKVLYDNKHKWIYLTLLCIAVWVIFQDDTNSVFHYVNNAIKRSPAFFIGVAIAPLAQRGVQVNFPILLICSVVSFTLAYMILPLGFCKWILILPMALICGLVIEKCTFLREPLGFLGVISLESYLTNITLGDILNHKSWIVCGYDLSYGHYLEYTIVVNLGIFLAWIFNRISNKVLMR